MFFDTQYDKIRDYSAQYNLLVPTSEIIQYDTLLSKTHWFCEDCKRYALLGQRRTLFIRAAVEGEFECTQRTHPTFPTLWVMVRRVSQLHIRHAFLRGDRPYVSEPMSDAAVECIWAAHIQEGGIDLKAFERFFNSIN